MFTTGTATFKTNDYLSRRNKRFFRGHSPIIHPLYQKELSNAIESINLFLSNTILTKAYYLRQKAILDTAAEKCYKNNDYTFSEAKQCQQLLVEKDVALKNIESFNKEVEVRIQDAWEKEVKFSKQNDFNSKDFSFETFEADHRKFLLNLHFQDRLIFDQLARKLFIEPFEIKN